MGMFVHGDNEEKAFYEGQSAMQTLGINGSALVAHYTDPIAPPTHKDVLLERWKKDTEAMASLMLFHNPLTGQIGACGMDGMVFAWFEWIKDALAAQIAYLNSAAEVGK